MLGLIALGLGACTPADEQYCQSYGVGGTPEFGKCLDYYHQQQAVFGAARADCDLQADATYPRSLYDNGGYVPVMGGPWGGPFGPPGGYAFVEPDYRRNAQIDQLRLRIVGPCMSAKGWNSPVSWQAGRHDVTPVKQKKLVLTPATQAPAAPSTSLNSLPWLQ